MPTITTTVACPIHDSFRVQQVAGMFDVPLADRATERFEVDVPGTDEEWRIGLIVGPSGSGKSTVARHAFKSQVYESAEWPADRAVVDGIPATSWPRAMLDCASVVRDGYGKMITRAEQSDLFDMNALVAAMERAPRHRGAARIRRARAELHPASSWSKSDLEDAMLRLCQRLDLAGPVCNAMVEGFEVDFLWLEHRLVAEADGWGFHKTRSAFQRDRTRDRALQLAGYRVLRFAYADVEYRPELVAADLRRALR